jgi:hypothetical protein
MRRSLSSIFSVLLFSMTTRDVPKEEVKNFTERKLRLNLALGCERHLLNSGKRENGNRRFWRPMGKEIR